MSIVLIHFRYRFILIQFPFNSAVRFGVRFGSVCAIRSRRAFMPVKEGLAPSFQHTACGGNSVAGGLCG